MNFKELKVLLEEDSTIGYFFDEKGSYYKVYYYDVPTFRVGNSTLVDPRYYCNDPVKRPHIDIRLKVPGKSYEEDIAPYLGLLVRINREEAIPSIARWVKRGLEQFYAEEEVSAFLSSRETSFDFSSCDEKLVIPIGSYAQKAAIAVLPAILKMMREIAEYSYVAPALEECYRVRMSWHDPKAPRTFPGVLKYFIPGEPGRLPRVSREASREASCEASREASCGASREATPETPLSIALSRKLRSFGILPTLKELKTLDLDEKIREWYGPGNTIRDPISGGS